jgi:hypothetical protein
VKAISAIAIVAIGALSAKGQPSPRMDGEYGLWVEDRRDTMVVRWITSSALPGYLQVATDAGTKQYTTDAAATHRVAFQRPRSRWVTLVYGAQDHAAERATTRINMQLAARSAVQTGHDSVYVMADTHGEFDATTRTLLNAGLIGADLKWKGGRKHLVFVGDLLDRGEDVVRLLWFVYGLEQQAAEAGGKVHVLLGNHETMVWLADLRYVTPKELSIAKAYGVEYPKLFDIRESVLGRWLVSKPAVLKVDGILFAHGGVSSTMLPYTVKTLDDTLAKFVGEELFYRWADRTATFKIDSAAYARRVAFFQDPNSVFWFRGYVQSDTLAPMLDAVLKRYGAVVHVVGHTPTTAVHQKYHEQLIAAHPRTPGIELVLLVKDGRNYRRFRIDQSGAVMPLPAKS